MTSRHFPPVLVAIGSNLPHLGQTSAEVLSGAIAAMPNEDLEVVAISRFFSTPCFPAGAGPDYVNAALVLRPSTADDATSILAALHRIEITFARERAQRWGMRTLDLDLLAMGDLVLPDAATQDRWRAIGPVAQATAAPDRLILPHPRMQDRAFVLVPLADVAADWVHPRIGLTVAAMRDALPAADRAVVVPLEVMPDALHSRLVKPHRRD